MPPFFQQQWRQLRHQLRLRYRLFRNRDRYVPETAGFNWSLILHNRIEIINRAVAGFGAADARYLEIGCADNTCFSSIIASHKVGVDPHSGGTIRKSSDEFFATNSETFDVVFIDGHHEYGQVRRDIVNSLAALRVGGFVFAHDLLPNTWEDEVPFPLGGFYTGDVWKVSFELTGIEGASFRIVKADYGVGVIRKQAETVLFPDRSAELGPLGFRDYLARLPELPVISFDDYIRFLGAQLHNMASIGRSTPAASW